MTNYSDSHEMKGGGRWRVVAWSIAALLLLLPLVAMQFSEEVDWSAADFAFVGTLLLFCGLAYELAVRTNYGSAYRLAVGVTLLATFLLVWINGAVGIIGSENNQANLLFGGVLGVALLGAAIARFKPRGMARTLAATALAQSLVGVVALVAGWGAGGASWPWDVVLLTGFFTVLWLLSAWFFRRATRRTKATTRRE